MPSICLMNDKNYMYDHENKTKLNSNNNNYVFIYFGFYFFGASTKSAASVLIIHEIPKRLCSGT